MESSLPLDTTLIFPFLGKVQPEDQRYFLQQYVRRQEIAETKLLFRKGKSIEHLYVLISGTIEESGLVRTDPRPSARLERQLREDIADKPVTTRSLIGIYDLFHHRTHSTSAYAIAPTFLYEIDTIGLDWLMARVPNLANDFAPLDRVERLRTMPLLRNLGELREIILGFLADACTLHECRPGEIIYRVGDRAENLYFIDQGQVYLDFDQDRWLGNGATFGLLSADEVDPSVATFAHQAQAIKRTKLMIIAREAFTKITGWPPDARGLEDYARVEQILTAAKLPVFARFSEPLQKKMSGYVSHYCMPTPHILVHQREMNDSLWLLPANQRAQVHTVGPTGEALQPIGVEGPAYFGEAGLHTETPIEVTIEAEEESHWVRLHRLDLEQFSLDEGQKLKALLPQSPIPIQAQPPGQGVVYDWLQPGETIRLLCRRHWIDLCLKLAPSFGILVVLSSLSLLVALEFLAPSAWIYFVIGVGGLLMMGQVAWGLTDYLNDYLIVTNRRVVLQEEVLFFRNRRQEAMLERIQNVDIRIGFWGRLFRYGNIVIRTASATGSIPFTFVTNPREIEQKITGLRSLRRLNEEAQKRPPIQNFLEGRLRLRLNLPPYVCLLTSVAAKKPSSWQRLRHWVKLLLLWRAVSSSVGDHVIWRKHWLILFGNLTPAFSVLLIIVGFTIGQFLPWLAVLRPIFLRFDLLLLPIFVGDLVWIAWVVADWRNDTYEVTATTIVDIEKKPLFFDENRRTARLDEIQNIEVSVPSLFHSVFNFGNVKLQTASSNGDFTFNWVPAPHTVAAEIQRRIEAYQSGERTEAAKRRAQELPDWFDMYDLLGGVSKRRARPPLP